MKRSFLILFAVVYGTILLAVACREAPGPVPKVQQKEIALGEKIFVEKECGKCHSTGDQAVKTEIQAPDLTSVFLTVDTIFVKAHLQFVELSQMPPIDMAPNDISALTQYIAALHAKARTDPNLKSPDGVCSVCGAPLKMDQAKAAQLLASYADRAYYFECPDCKRMFERNPSWYAQNGYLATR